MRPLSTRSAIMGLLAAALAVLGPTAANAANGPSAEPETAEVTIRITDLDTNEIVLEETRLEPIEDGGLISVDVAPTSDPGGISPLAIETGTKTIDITSTLSIKYSKTTGPQVRVESVFGG